MKKLTDKQQAFATNKAAGLTHREAAIAAGYAINSAAVAATQLMARTDIKAAIKAAKKTVGFDADSKGDDAIDAKNAMPKASYSDPISFLEDVMNHKLLPLAMRADAAKQLLPYKHARIGEAGKKQNATDRAKEIANGGKKGDKHAFAKKEAPPLRVVNGGRQ